MDKELRGREGPVFGIDSSLGLFEKLKFEGRRLQDKWHPYDAFNFTLTAWHLFHDWPASDPPRALSRQKRQRRAVSPEMNLVLDVLRDLAAGSKHFTLDAEATAKRKVDTIHSGVIDDFYAWLFFEEMPAASAKRYYFSIRVLRNISERYFQWVFDDSSPVHAFPDEISEAIRYCDLSRSRPGPSPTLWLAGIEKTDRKE